MAGVFESYDRGPVTFEVNAQVTGGQMVVPDGTTGKVKPAAGGETTCLGVATLDAIPAGTNQDPTVVGVVSSLNAYPIPPYTAVANRGVFRVTYTAAATFGELLKLAANGQVTPFVTGTDNADLIVGRCFESAGVAAGATGDMLLSL